MNAFSFQATSLLVLFASSSAVRQKGRPQTTLNRDSGQAALGRMALGHPPMVLIRGMNSPQDASCGDFGNEDLLSPEIPLSGFSDPLNTIRPFDPVLFGFDQYNLTAGKLQKCGIHENNLNARLLIEGYCD